MAPEHFYPDVGTEEFKIFSVEPFKSYQICESLAL